MNEENHSDDAAVGASVELIRSSLGWLYEKRPRMRIKRKDPFNLESMMVLLPPSEIEIEHCLDASTPLHQQDHQ